MVTVKERLAHVMEVCGCPPARFHEWIGIDTRQRWQNWGQRDSLPPDGAKKVSETTGASAEWLMWNKGPPFPNGPTIYKGPKAVSAAPEVAELRRQLAAVYAVLGSVVRVFSARTPGAAGELELALAPLRATPGVEVLVAVAEEVRRAEEQAARSSAPKESAGKPRGRGR